MPSPIKMRTDYSAPQLRVLAKNAKTNKGDAKRGQVQVGDR